MKNIIIIIMIIALSGCASSLNINTQLDQNYFIDISSENNRIAGDLYLDLFNDDLSLLTYDFYLTFISKNEAPSAKGFSSKVKNADYHYFKSMKDYFVIALYYKNQRTIICDNSNTAFLDSLHTYDIDDKIPELSTFVEKYLKK